MKSLQWKWFSEELKKEDIYFFHVVINPQRPPFVDELLESGIPAFHFRHKNFLSHISNVFRACRLVREHKIDIVHTSLPYGNLIGMLAAIITGIKVKINTCENASWAHDFNHTKQRLLDRFTFSVSNRTIAVSESAYEYLHEKWKIAEGKLTLINHGLNFEEFEELSDQERTKLRAKYGVGPSEFVIGMIARMEFWKGHKYAIHAISRLREKYPEIRLLIFGAGGSDQANVLGLINDLHLQKEVRFMGFTEEPQLIYQVFDIHLHIPINKYVENCGINIIEGMASKRPQILTLSGYANQSAEDMKNALVVNYQDSVSVEKAIERLITSEKLRIELANNTYQTAVQNYSNEVKTKNHLMLYHQLLSHEKET